MCIESASSKDLEYFSLKDNRIKIIRTDTQNIEQLGVEASRGEYMLFKL